MDRPGFNLPPKLDLSNICDGKVPEVFNHILQSVFANIKDPNTVATKARKIKIEFSFTPSEDRQYVEIEFKVNPGLQSVKPQKGSAFLSAVDGSLSAYPRDPRQEALFAASEPGKRQ